MDEVFMDTDAVRTGATTFGAVSDVLQVVSRTLQALITTLKTTAFMGLVGGLAVAHFLEMIKPHIDNMADQCEELNQDLNRSVEAFEQCDEMIAAKFRA